MATDPAPRLSAEAERLSERRSDDSSDPARPTPDGVHKIIQPRPPAIFTVYVGERFLIFYRLRDHLVIIDAIERR